MDRLSSFQEWERIIKLEWLREQSGSSLRFQSQDTSLAGYFPCPHQMIFFSITWIGPNHSGIYSYFNEINSLHQNPISKVTYWLHPLSLGAKASNEDTPTLREIHKLQIHDMEDWYKAMDLELEALHDKNTMN
jgi:hypothetical protein